MKQIDFSKVIVESIDGNAMPTDMRFGVGNMLYMNGSDIAECELGRKIFKQEPGKPTNISDEEVAILRKHIPTMTSYIFRQALMRVISDEPTKK